MGINENEGSGPAVVGIGTSAGGLAALKQFFSHTPADTGLAYVVVMHLAPGQPSTLAELLQPGVAMPVQQVKGDVPLEANQVYVIPPGSNLSTLDSHLRLSRFEDRRSQRTPIDHFFETLAQTHAGRCAAVILSGTGTDGRVGVSLIKEGGGLTLAQEPREAEFDGMPRSAIASGFIDMVLPVGQMPAQILRFIRTKPDVPVRDERAEAAQHASQVLQAILAELHKGTGQEFSRYKPSTLLRRIRRRMQLNHTEDLSHYLARLRRDPGEVRALADELLITVTQFFRDAETFTHIQEQVIPALFAGKGASDSVRVWSVGCATGEEPYSLAMLLLEQAAQHDEPPRLEIFASDAHEGALQRAREGLYPGAIAGYLSAERLRRFFVEENGFYRVHPHLREIIVFATHNLLRDPPFSRLDLIVCRNLLIYLQRDLQGQVIELFHYALNPGGWLWLGSAETVDRAGLFELQNKCHALYRRRNVPAPALSLPVFPSAPGSTRADVRGDATPVAAPTPGYGLLHQRMVERIAPPSLLVDQDLQVVHVSEHCGRYLSVTGGEPSAQVLKLVREPLQVELQVALERAGEQGLPQRTQPVVLELEGGPQRVVAPVRPALGDALGGLNLVIFEEWPVDQTPAPEDRPAASAPVDATELARTRERLRAVIEQHETAQEEMKAANEELQSTNEELRSTMEELETSKEELQSMNEELQTVNQESRNKVAELSQLSADLNNLMAASDIATLFLDRALHIMRATPRASELFNIRASDSGRPLSDLHGLVAYDEFELDARQVLESLIPVQREVQGQNGTWYLTRVLPYRSTADQIQGVVLTLVEITERKQAELALSASERRLRALVQASSDVVYRMSPDWREMRQLLSRGFLADTQEPSQSWLEKYIPANEQPAVQAAIAEAIHTKQVFELEHQVRRADGTLGWSLSRAVPVLDDAGELVEWFGMASDITARKHSEQALKELNRTLEQRVAARTADVQRQAEQLRALANQLGQAERAERKRIAKILHDHVQQLIVGALIQVRSLTHAPATERRRAATMTAQRLKDILNKALDASRSLAVELSPPILDEAGLVGGLDWLVARLRLQHGLDVRLRADPAAEPATEGVRVMLFESVRELLLNVVKHAEVAAAELTLTRGADTEIRLVVSDAGRGFDPEAAQQRRLDAGCFGLFSIQERLAHLGGRMELESAPGQGTRVTLVVPGATAEPGTESAPTPAEKAGEAMPLRVGERSQACRVLIVDDHPVVREGLASLFEHEPDIEVVGQAGDGPEAIAATEILVPDVVLMDVNLGGMSGVEATGRILAARPATKVIGLSMHGDQAVADAMRAAGAVAYVRKGGQPEELIEAIRACYRR